MASDLYWFYDLLIIGVALIYFYSGAKRGLMRSVVLVVLTVASVAVSWFAGTVFSPVIYDRFIKEPAVSAVTASISKVKPASMVSQTVNAGGYGVEMTEDETQTMLDGLEGDYDFVSSAAAALKLNGAADTVASLESDIEAKVIDRLVSIIGGGKVADSTVKEIFDRVSVTNQDFRSAMNIFVKGDAEKTVGLIEEKMIAPAMKAVLRSVIWFVSMFIFMLLSRTLANLFKKLNNVPIIGPINSTLGAVLGLAEGIVVIYLIAQAVNGICLLTSDSLMFLNSRTVGKTYLFRYFSEFDIISLFG